MKRAANPLPGPRRVKGINDGRGDEFDEAICRTVDPELWWSWQGMTGHGAAKALCLECPVRRLCAESALAHGDEWGIWGGFDMAHERDAARQWVNLAEAVSA
ncbi:WhiB family transcriptional regulator [Nocardia cyriacigeorgica]|uniref:WhiB family transcriptional regulator n=1 Tax=Nocardia cyriacigeorgica TaxID=135487 RepID=UPI002456555E|nr:WhiB family transcriptional regulator [Nocardia cyriacigeorgica]